MSSSDNNSCHIHIRYVIAFSAIMREEKTSHGVCLIKRLQVFVLFCFAFFFLLTKVYMYLFVQMASRGKSWR